MPTESTVPVRARAYRRAITIGVLLLLIAAIAVILRGCVFGFAIDPALMRGPAAVSVQARSAESRSFTIEPGSPEYIRITDWLRSHRGGWVYDINTHAPSTEVTTGNFWINFMNGGVVINYRKPGGRSVMTQVSKRIKGFLPPVINDPATPVQLPTDLIIQPPPAPRSAPR